MSENQEPTLLNGKFIGFGHDRTGKVQRTDHGHGVHFRKQQSLSLATSMMACGTP